jgi:shikimate kinase
MTSPSPRRPLVFVGMSGVGKSHLSRLLGTIGHRVFDVDTLIAGALGDLVKPAPDESPVHALGRWMDMPWTDGFEAREAQYLALEERITAQCFDEAFASTVPTVVDTTGSVIYLSAPLRARLREAGRVVYFHTPESDRARMREQYLQDPKPVCWGGLFRREGDETPRETTERLYPRLLETRDALYRTLAHELVEGPELRDVTATALAARLGV